MLWKADMDWDQSLSDDQRDLAKTLHQELNDMENLEFPCQCI